MKVTIAGGKIEFRCKFTAENTGVVSKGEDKGTESSQVENDLNVKTGFVSLATKKVRIAAVDLKINDIGNIKRIGWANIILSSERNYHYKDTKGGTSNVTITETIDNLPTWDGDAKDTWPFYLGSYVSTDAADKTNPDCSNIVSCAGRNTIGFDDAPSMPPSYGTYFAAGMPIGKAILHRNKDPSVRMTHISGADRYLACLTIIDKKGGLHVAWSVLWTVEFGAVVTLDPPGIPQVRIKPGSKVRVNVKHALNAMVEVGKTRGKPASATQKRYLSSGLSNGLPQANTTDNYVRAAATDLTPTPPARARSVSF